MLQQIPYGNTDKKISQLSLGTMWFGTSFDEKLSYNILDTYAEFGGTTLDTANCYAWWHAPQYVGDESENLLGKWMKERKNRQEIFLASKMGARPNHPERLWDAQGNARWDLVKDDFEYLAPATIRKAVEDSLRRLQTDVMDLYYVHIDDPVTPIDETLYTMHQLVKEGKVRYIGCSNFSTDRVKHAHQLSKENGWEKYTALQYEYSYFEPKPEANLGGETSHAEHELLQTVQQQDDLVLFAYSPILKGIYDDERKRESYYNWHAFDTPENQIRLQKLNNLSKQIGVNNTQLVLAWIMKQSVVPIMGASSPEQLKQNLKCLSFKLSDDDFSYLNNI